MSLTIPDFLQPRLAEAILAVGVVLLMAPGRWMRERGGDLALLVVALSAVGAVAAMNAPEGFLFHRMIAVDPFGAFLKFLLSMSALAVLWQSSRTGDRDAVEGRSWALFVVSLLAMDVAASAVHVLPVWGALEVASLSAAAWRGGGGAGLRARHGAMAMLIEGRAASAMLLLGFALLFGLTGSLSYQVMGDKLALALAAPGGRAVMFAGLALVVVGAGSRVGMQPWSLLKVDSVARASPAAAAWLSVGPTIVGLAVLLRFLRTVVAHPVAGGAWTLLPAVAWPDLLSLGAIATMISASLAALRARDLGRMAAWIAVVQAGFGICGLVVAGDRAVAALLFHLVAFALAMPGLCAALGVAVANHRAALSTEEMASDGAPSAEEGASDEQAAGVEALRGLARRGWSARFVAATIVLFLLSLNAVAPLAGYEGRVLLMAGVFETGRPLLATVAGLSSLLGLLNVARMAALLLDRPREDAGPLSVDGDTGFLLALLVAGILVIGANPSALQSFVERSAVFFPS